VDTVLASLFPAIPVSQVILAHLFSYDISWSTTLKEVQRSNFFMEVLKIAQRCICACSSLASLMCCPPPPFVCVCSGQVLVPAAGAHGNHRRDGRVQHTSGAAGVARGWFGVGSHLPSRVRTLSFLLFIFNFCSIGLWGQCSISMGLRSRVGFTWIPH
jgi:hypothetical protein